jgi:hypothetical protein
MRSFLKRIIPKEVLIPLRKMRNNYRSILRGIPHAPKGTDWVGYETLIEFIRMNDILSVKGDFVEIGTFLGGGARRLSKFLDNNRIPKKLFVIDVFDPNFDWTNDISGRAMASLYLDALKKYHGKSQWEVFLNTTKGCRSLIVLKGDSKEIEIPTDSVCFGFIDGNHDPEYVENDFYLIWNKLSSEGAVAFHDYDFDLPQTTAKINELVKKHYSSIQETFHHKNKHILFVIKK